MLSPKELKRLKDSSLVMEKEKVAVALAQKELVVPVTFDYATDGTGTQEVTTITCVADDSDSLDGTSFLLYDEAGSVGVWIDTDDSGTTIPTGANAADRALEVTTVTTDMTASQVAGVLATAINGDSKFTATADGAVVTVTCIDPESVANAADAAGAEATGFTFATATEGVSVINLDYTFKEDAIVTGVSSYEISNVTSGGSATVAVNAGSTALVAATAISSFAGYKIHTLSGSADGIAVAKGDRINIDVEVAPLTAGKVRFYIKALPLRDIL